MKEASFQGFFLFVFSPAGGEGSPLVDICCSLIPQQHNVPRVTLVGCQLTQPIRPNIPSERLWPRGVSQSFLMLMAEPETRGGSSPSSKQADAEQISWVYVEEIIITDIMTLH